MQDVLPPPFAREQKSLVCTQERLLFPSTASSMPNVYIYLFFSLSIAYFFAIFPLLFFIRRKHPGQAVGDLDHLLWTVVFFKTAEHNFHPDQHIIFSQTVSHHVTFLLLFEVYDTL